MKTYLPLLFFALAVLPTRGEESTEPQVLPAAFAQKVNPNGSAVMAQDISGSAIVYDVETGEANWYGGYYPGNGNSLSNTGVLVGQDMETSRGVIIKDGEPKIPKPLFSVLQSSLDAITPDGSRVCGWSQNARSGPMQIPFYIDIADNGTVGDAQALPYPSKGLFNDTPQFCTATYMSDDGKTIAGLVQDDSGFFSYPIVYKQNEDGEWSYILPSEPMFNPDHLEIPSYPDLDKLDFPAQPRITDFMTPEKRAEWDADMAEYNATGDESINPWTFVTYYTGEEGYAAYENAIIEYNHEVNDIVGGMLDNYWRQMAAVGKNARFLPNMALSPNGDFLLADLGLTDDEYAGDVSTGYVTYKFDLVTGAYSVLESIYEDLLPTQILTDGTVIAVGHPYSEWAYNSFIRKPEAADYISVEDYLAVTNPSYLVWMNENLDTFGDGIVSGIVSFNEDMTLIAGGNPYGDMISYVFAGANAGVKGIEVPETGEYKVYNLSGIKVLTTKEKRDLSGLPKGIYIINGKKIKL